MATQPHNFWGTVSGAGIGATIGTVVFPVVGTAIGGLIGAGVGYVMRDAPLATAAAVEESKAKPEPTSPTQPGY